MDMSGSVQHEIGHETTYRVLGMMKCDSHMTPIVCVTQLIAEFAMLQSVFAWFWEVTIATVVAEVRHGCEASGGERETKYGRS